MEQISRKFLEQHYWNKKLPVKKIAAILRCSEHRVNYWIKQFRIPKRSISEAIYLANNPNGDPFKVKKVESVKDAKLLGLGLGLYWGEGNKKNKSSIRLGNTAPGIIREFIRFLVVILGISTEKLKFGLQIFSDINPQSAMKFWLANLKEFDIKNNQFSKIIVTPSRSIGSYREKSQNGVLTVYFNNVKLKKILDNMLPT